ncbi:hypothetical protein MLD38_024882 [Melastoma candidum]|uniref:Uncharacterized protein n=1 Tax=Melastoma candidum TaxID=119954 RepID=A0ACB9NVD3_9MYRT|nr:hypothetical protein MLD38_024882 [Melastoma candidum]
MPAILGNLFFSSFSLFVSINHVVIIPLVFSSSFFFGPCVYSLDAQGQALLSWKNGLNGSAQALASWTVADPNPCGWFGVRCDSHGEVIEIHLKSVDLQGTPPSNLQPLKSLQGLDLSSANISGVIPKEFGDYKELRFIDLSDNLISGEIPVELCGLGNLQSLSLSSNFLEGGIPAEIGNLSSLTYLTLFDNQLSGRIPRSIGAMKRLQVFRAGGNKNISGQVPWEIGNCSDLVILGLAETSVSGNLPSSIGMLKNIQTIAIYTAQLSGSIPDEIGNCTELQNLYLYQNTISGLIPKRLGELSKLQSLLLWQNSLTGLIPDELGSCGELTVVDLSENLLTGSIPRSFGNLLKLQELQLSINQLTSSIPPEITSCTAMTQLEIDNNYISGGIPAGIGNLKNLTLFFAWQNRLTGNIPTGLSQCQNLQAVDFSYNNLSGSVPKEIFGLTNLTKLLLLSNDLSGFIPPDIGNCTALYRLRLNRNRLSGTVPSEIGKLASLNFLDLGDNRLEGGIPPALSGCGKLEFMDLHSNRLSGPLPDPLPQSLQVIDVSDNGLTGTLNASIGSLIELMKLNLGRNQLSGRIPVEISSCTQLQQLDLGENGFFGEIPKEIGQLSSLEISLNLSFNQFSGELPLQFSGLTKLADLDLSHNKLSGSLSILADLQNLVYLNVSFNEFSGELPDTVFFKKLPPSDLAGNQGLHVLGKLDALGSHSKSSARAHKAAKTVTSILVAASVVLVLLAIYMLIQGRRQINKGLMGHGTWEVTLYQKLDCSIDDIVRNLTANNVIGTGSSGAVYRVMTPSGETFAVKKMWSMEESGAFSSEIQTLGSVRHKNIVRLLGWCSNRHVKLLFYDYLPKGSLSSLLHGTGKGEAEWETRHEIVLGVAHALAYLHHDCVPAILHGDVKAMNVLLGPRYEPFLADFGLARVVSKDSFSKVSRSPRLAGSYGYMAPEHATMQRITEKSDVYSFGVLLLEVLTGRHPLDPTLPGGAHLVQWAYEHLITNQEPADILDSNLRGREDRAMHEMLQTLAVSFLCLSTRASERPTMKDVVAMLNEIRYSDPTRPESDNPSKGLTNIHPRPSLPQPPKDVASRGSSLSSFAFSYESMP